MIDSVEATGPRKSAGDTRPAYEFIVRSVRQHGDGDVPDLVLRRRPIQKAGQPEREEVTVIVREIASEVTSEVTSEINTPPEAKMAAEMLPQVVAPASRPAGDRVAEYVASLSDDVTENVDRVVDTIIAEEERVDAPAELASLFASDGSPFVDSALPTPPSPHRYTKRVEFDRS